VINWINPAGGLANVASNWSPAQVPTAADDLSFNLASAYSVTYGADVSTTRSQTYRQGTVTASFGVHTITSQLQIGQSSGNNATLNMSGVVTSTSFVTLGRDSGSNGTLTVSPGLNFLTTTGAGFDIIVGQAGQGTLNIGGGNQVRIDTNADDIIIGNLAGSIGTVNVSSSNAQLAVLRINNTTPGADLIIGASGAGTLNLGVRASVSAGFNAFVALNPGSSGSVSSIAPFGLTSGALNVPNDLHVGHNTTAAAAGNATITVDDDAIVQAGVGVTTGTLFLGDSNGGSGTINLIKGEVRTENLVIDPVNGHFNHAGGRLLIQPGGSFTTNTRLELSGTLANNPPTVEFRGSTGTLTGGFFIGNSGTGSVEVTQGALVNAVPQPPGGLGSGFMTLGNAAGAVGTLTISGTGSQLIASGVPSGFLIGSAGTGHVVVSDHATLSINSHILMAAFPGSSGTLDIATSSSVTVPNQLSIGGLLGPQGTATVNLSGSSNLSAGGIVLRAGSSISIVDSTVTGSGAVTLEGQTTLAQGAEIAAANILISGTLSGSGNVYGTISAAPTAVITAAGGDLFLGSPSNAPNSFTNSGTLAVNDQPVHILSSTPSPAGTISVAGGSIIGPGGLAFGPGDSLNGGGNILTPVSFHADASISATHNQGFTFNSPVSGTLIASGTAGLTFAAGGDLTGSGIINSPFTTEEEASVTATGLLDIGSDSRILDVRLAGPLHIGNHPVTLRSDTPVHLGVATTINGGSLRGPANNVSIITIFDIDFTRTDAVPLVLNPFSTLTGAGAILSKLNTREDSIILLSGDMSFVGSSQPPVVFNFGSVYVSWAGNLSIGSHTASFSGVHINDGNVTLAGGVLACGSSLYNRGSITGNGSIRINFNTFTNWGLISPGGTAIGSINIEGGYTSGSPAVLEMDVDGDQGFLHDTITVVSGEIALGGHLAIRVLTANPDPSVEYPLIVSNSGIITGAFTTADLPPGFTIIYRDHEVVLTGACPADFNQDGGIDGSDVDAFFASWESGDSAADVNRDGGVDGSDVDVFFSLWEAGGC
jgi:T5SS/PEP-CTERM-associated repeat protein